MINKTQKQIELKGNGYVIGNEIYVPYLDKTLAFKLPEDLEDIFRTCGDYFDDFGIKNIFGEGIKPITSQILSLVDIALQNKEEEHCSFVLSGYEKGLYTFTMNLYTPTEIIVYDSFDGKMNSNRDSLLKRHADGDKTVRLVNYGFKTGYQSVDEFLVNPYVIAQVGNKNMVDVAQRVAESSKIFQPFVNTLDRPIKEIQTYTTLNSNNKRDWLKLNGNPDSGQGGYGFPMRIL